MYLHCIEKNNLNGLSEKKEKTFVKIFAFYLNEEFKCNFT